MKSILQQSASLLLLSGSSKNSASAWRPRQLRNSLVYSFNIAAYNGRSDTDPKYHPPLYILSLVNTNPKCCLDEVVIARHQNRSADPSYNHLISIQARARIGVSQKMWDAFFKQKGLMTYLPTNYTQDARPRIALTDTCDSTLRLDKFIDFINELAPLSTEITQQINSLMIPRDDNDVVANLPHKFPYDEKASPPYFQHAAAQMPANGGARERYYDRFDDTIVEHLPPIHQAILNRDYQTINSLLAQDPELANMKDPWGEEAHFLAQTVGPLDLFKLFYEARKKIKSYSLGDEDQKQIDYHWLKHKEADYREPTAIDFKSYLQKIQQPIPVRSPLHAACRDGNIDLVKQILTQSPERLEEQDPRGYTPLIIAMAKNHTDVVRWLLQKGASTQEVMFWFSRPGVEAKSLFCFHPADHASTPEIMELILYYSVDPHIFHENLAKAIRENNIPMAKCMLYYLKKLPIYRGLTALEYALQQSAKHGSALLSSLLNFYDDYVPEGEYDLNITELVRTKFRSDPTHTSPDSPYAYNISPEIADMLKKHNTKIERLEYIRANKQKLLSDEFIETKGVIKSKFLAADGTEIISIIKPLSMITHEDSPNNPFSERAQLKKIFLNCFKMCGNDIPESQEKYITDAFIKDDHTPNESEQYINLFKVKEKLISFFTFEIKESIHPDYNEFTLFHAKLAGNEDIPAAKELANLAFRVPLAMMELEPKMKLFNFFKAIPPGNGLRLIPKFVRFFPKYVLSSDFMMHIVSLVGEQLNDKTMPAKLEVITSRQNTKSTFVFDYFEHIVPAGTKAGMATCFKFDELTIKEYMDEFAYNDIHENNNSEFASCWSAFRAHHQKKVNEITPDPKSIKIMCRG